ncbi:MAG: sulfotransferase [Pseudomonadota bacterium]|nr:sulfotransferase [Pseudomonadota bacterium]
MGRRRNYDSAQAKREFSQALRDVEVGSLSRAEKRLRRLARAFPDNAPVQFNLALVLQQQGRNAAAVEAFRFAAKADPKNPDVWLALGQALVAKGEVAHAKDSLERVIGLQVGSTAAYMALGNIFVDSASWADAERIFRVGLDAVPADETLTVALAQVLAAQGCFKDAKALLDEAVELRPNAVSLWIAGGQLRHITGRVEQAVSFQQRALLQHPKSVALLLQQANSLSELQWPTEAESLYRQVLELAPGHPDALNNQALLMAADGRREEAEAIFRRLIASHPEFGDPYRNLTALKHYVRIDDSDIQMMQAAVRRSGSTSPGLAALHYALAKAFDDCGKYDRAFHHYRQANECYQQSVQFDIAEVVRRFDQLQKVFNQAFYERRQGWGDKTERPIFIVGLPRSGTTLLEQVLASHPDISAAGELRKVSELVTALEDNNPSGELYPTAIGSLDTQQVKSMAKSYLDEVAQRKGAARRVTDKMPMNFIHVGLLRLLFPKAAIIHCRRNPLDTGLSIYSQLFPRGVDYAYRLENIGAYYRQYRDLMDHWRKVLSGTLIEIDYEQLVTAPKKLLENLLEMLGLDWSEACLAHHKRVGRVETLSQWQVRQPLHSESVERWLHYEKHLQPLREVLDGAAASDQAD